jgi:tagatose 6-phosphate kinase
MILTITLNPLLERRFEFNKISPGKNNRGASESIAAGGKGINVSRQLNQLGIDNSALTFTGGYTGKLFKKILAEEKIKASFIQINEETRNAAVVIDSSENSVTTYFGRNSTVTKDEAEAFLNKIEPMISNCEMVVLSGSSPSPETDHIFPEAIKLANRFDKISILDTYGSHLSNCLNAVPTVIHNNLEEISSLYNVSDEEPILKTLDDLYTKGIKQAFLTNGGSPTFASNFDFHFKVTNPVYTIKDPTGSGDAFTAGIVFGWHNNLTFEETVIMASCLGAANASVYQVCSSTLNDAENFRNSIEVVPIGKKMKTIDVTPR